MDDVILKKQMRFWKIFSVLLGLFWFLLLLKYYFFGYIDWDLAFFSQASWKLLHGDQFVPLVGINFFGDHSYFIQFFVLPFFHFIPSPLTLIFLKLAAFFVAAYFLYRVAEERLGEGLALCVMLLYLFFPGNLFGLFYEFNTEAFAPPFIVLMFVALHKKNIRLMILWALFLVLVKENMFLVAAAFGVRAFFVSEKDRVLSVIFTVTCLAAFLYLVTIVIPHFRGLGHHAFSVRYAWLGNSAQEAILRVMQHPQKFFKILLGATNLKYLGHLFSYLLLPALFSPVALCLMLPLLLQHLLSSHLPEHTIYYHYASAMAPFIFIALIETLVKVKRYRNVLVGIIMLLMVSALVSHRAAMVLFNGRILNTSQAVQSWKLIDRIPADAPVMASFRFLSALSVRPELYSFHMLYSDQYNNMTKMERSELNIQKAFTLPQRVKYALIDLTDPTYCETLSRRQESELKRIDDFFSDTNWKLIGRTGPVLLLKR